MYRASLSCFAQGFLPQLARFLVKNDGHAVLLTLAEHLGSYAHAVADAYAFFLVYAHTHVSHHATGRERTL